MEATLRSASGLYPNLLGDSWHNLDDAVRGLHENGTAVLAAGKFRVCRGTTWLARTLALLTRLPAAGPVVEIQLLITSQKDGEEWRRSFAGRRLVSTLSRRSDGLLAERMGLVEMRFRLEVIGGALKYQTTSTALCIGPCRVPLSRWLSPRVMACERTCGAGSQVHVCVEVQLPWLGRLLAYEGKLRVEVQR